MRSALPFCLIVTLAPVGCADPQGEFDAFTERKGQPDIASGMPECDGEAATAADIAGSYVFGIAPVPLNPQSAIYFLARVSEDQGKANFRFTALSASDRDRPVGEEFDIGSYEIAANGGFVATLPPLTVVGAANPVTPCAAITAEVTLTGRFCRSAVACAALDGGAPPAEFQPPQFYWGLVAGNVTRPTPLKLDGSLFTMQRIASDTARPATYVANCAGLEALPESTENCD